MILDSRRPIPVALRLTVEVLEELWRLGVDKPTAKVELFFDERRVVLLLGLMDGSPHWTHVIATEGTPKVPKMRSWLLKTLTLHLSCR